ncbi:hypothetical protein QZH41_015350 [Actinostola sp. cb2023]|nr:hypothetical protein QZH41_015350 [Actinostola sp. cb2023]
MAGFERAGLPGCEFIRQSLTNSTDLAAAIENFQHDNGVLLPSLQSALPFLDLHGVGRLEFHTSVMDHLKETVLQKIKTLEEPKLKEILEQSFPFIHVEELRPVVMQIMKYLPKVSVECLEHIANDTKLYEDSTIEVKRQIWVKHHHLFGDAVGPLLKQYLQKKYEVLHATDSQSCNDFFSISSKVRRQRDIAMILCDPFAVNTIAKSIIKLLHRLAHSETLPRSTNDIHFLLKLLSLGVGAWDMIEKQAFREIIVNPDLAGKFLPFIMSLMVDSSLRSYAEKVPEEDIEEELLVVGHKHAQDFMDMLATDNVAFTLAWCYLLSILKQKDKASLLHVLPWFVSPCQARPLDEMELHTLVASLVGMQEEFASSDFCNVVFDNFLLGLTSQTAAIRHTLRLLWFVYPKIYSHKVVQILTATQPESEVQYIVHLFHHPEDIHELHSALVDRIASANPSTPSQEQTSSVSSMGSSSHSPLEYIQPESS